MNNKIISLIEEKMSCKVVSRSILGKGASGCVYKVAIDKEPYNLAVKIGNSSKLIIDEYNSIDFISSLVDCKLPKLYFVDTIDGSGVLAMQLIEGVTPCRKTLIFKRNKQKLANEIVDNLIKIHGVHNDKFGPIDNAVFDTWFDYYSVFASEILEFTKASDVPQIVKKAVALACDNLQEIIGTDSGKPTLAHGDYWFVNFIIDDKTMSLNGIIDPFNVSWTEPEYELFTLTVGYGKNLRLYDLYKDKVNTTKNCDIKVELYALFNELNWYKALGTISFGYLKYRSRRLIKMLLKA